MDDKIVITKVKGGVSYGVKNGVALLIYPGGAIGDTFYFCVLQE